MESSKPSFCSENFSPLCARDREKTRWVLFSPIGGRKNPPTKNRQIFKIPTQRDRASNSEWNGAKITPVGAAVRKLWSIKVCTMRRSSSNDDFG